MTVFNTQTNFCPVPAEYWKRKRRQCKRPISRLMPWITAIIRRDTFGKRGMRSKIGITLGYLRSYLYFVEVFTELFANFGKLQFYKLVVKFLKARRFVSVSQAAVVHRSRLASHFTKIISTFELLRAVDLRFKKSTLFRLISLGMANRFNSNTARTRNKSTKDKQLTATKQTAVYFKYICIITSSQYS